MGEMEVKERKKKKGKTIIKIILLIILLWVFVSIYHQIKEDFEEQKREEALQEEIANQKEQEKIDGYIELVKSYVQEEYKILLQTPVDNFHTLLVKSYVQEEYENYQQEFVVEFYKKQYQSNEIEIPTTDSTWYIGDNENIQEYLFVYYPIENKDIKGCVAIRYPIDAEEDISVVELSYGYDGMQFFSPYEYNIENMERKQKASEYIKQYLGEQYVVDLSTDARILYVNTEQNFHDLVIQDRNNEYKNILVTINNLAKDELKYQEIIIKYQENTTFINSCNQVEMNDPNDSEAYSSFEQKNDILFNREWILEELKNVFENSDLKIGNKYDTYTFNYNFININAKYQKYKKTDLIQKIKEVSMKYSEEIRVKFSDYYITIKDNGEIKESKN